MMLVQGPFGGGRRLHRGSKSPQRALRVTSDSCREGYLVDLVECCRDPQVEESVVLDDAC
jgi:hypothetical protein